MDSKKVIYNKIVNLVMIIMMATAFLVAPAMALAVDNPDDVKGEDAKKSEKVQTGDENNDSEKTDVNKDESIKTEYVKSEAKTDEKIQTKKAKKPKVVKATPVKWVDAVGKKHGKAVVRWGKSKNADGYYIYRAKYKNGKYKKVKRIPKKSSQKYTHKFRNISTNKNYYYKVLPYKVIKGKEVITNSKKCDAAKNTLRYRKSFRVKATAYSGGGYCANGKRVKVGRIAVDPRVIPLGTWLYVKGYGICQACDTGGAIKGKKIDIYLNSERKCNRWGVRGTRVYILK